MVSYNFCINLEIALTESSGRPGNPSMLQEIRRHTPVGAEREEKHHLITWLTGIFGILERKEVPVVFH